MIQIASALIAILFFLSVSAISRINGIVLLVQYICILVLFINYQVFLFRAQFAEIMIKTIERELLKEEWKNKSHIFVAFIFFALDIYSQLVYYTIM